MLNEIELKGEGDKVYWFSDEYNTINVCVFNLFITFRASCFGRWLRPSLGSATDIWNGRTEQI